MNNNENDYTKSIGFGYDQSNLAHEDCNLLNSTIAGYLAVLLADHIRHRNAKLETGKHARKG